MEFFEWSLFIYIYIYERCGNTSPPSDQEPRLTGFRPEHGPVFGGTAVTLTGRHLDSGTQRDVFFADKKCNIQK